MDYKEKVIALLNSQELSKEQKEKLEEIFPELAELEEEITSQIRLLTGLHTFDNGKQWWKGTYNELSYFAKHFFELGLKAQKGETMTQEEKAKRYDEAIKVAKSNYETIVQMDNDCTFAKEGIVNTFHHIFPELAESEDEKTRKALIGFLKEEEAKADITSKRSKTLCKYIAWFEKQEQKPTDKVEPKFKVGDWVVLYPSEIEANRKVVQISRVERCQLNMYWTTEGTWFGDGTDARLWTIQDAKDGDVLVDSFTKDSIIILYKGIYKERSILAHCGWNGYNLSIKTNGLGYGGLDNTNYLPATKEQRDLLFSKMKEKGYEWSEDTHQLKKI